MSNVLHVRLWINGELVADKDIDARNAEFLSVEHAERCAAAVDAGKHYLLEISDPDLDGKVVLRSGSDPSQMEQPIRMDLVSEAQVKEIARQRMSGKR